MARKKRRSSKFRDSSAVIDIEQARQQRQERQQERQQKKKKMEAKHKTPRSEAGAKEAKRRQAAQTQQLDLEGLIPPEALEETFAQNPEAEAAEFTEEVLSSAEPAVKSRPKARTRSGQAKAEAGAYRERTDTRHDRRKMALRRRKRNRNLIIAGVLVVLFVIVGFSVGQIIVLKHDLYTAKKEQEAYKEEKAQLEKDLKQIDALENLEEQARDQMRLIKPGETLYIFPENMTPTQPVEDAGQSEDKEKGNDE